MCSKRDEAAMSGLDDVSTAGSRRWEPPEINLLNHRRADSFSPTAVSSSADESN